MEKTKFLEKAGFTKSSEDAKIYTKSLSDTCVVVAFINGDGVIFHLMINGKTIACTIQTVEYEDIAEAFKELMKALQTVINDLNNACKL